MRYPKQVTVESQTKKAQERLERYRLQLDLCNKILAVLPKYEGQKLSARLATAVQKTLPEGYTAHFRREYGMFHIDITRGGYGQPWPYEKIVSCLMGYESSNRWEAPFLVNLERIKDHNLCYTLNAERIPRLEAGLKEIPRMVAIRDQVLAGIADLIALAEKYEMDYDFDIEDK